MPGSRLTLAQACRLFGGDPRVVEHALQDLVDTAVLRQIGPFYLRADLGSFRRMSQADSRCTAAGRMGSLSVQPCRRRRGR